MKRPHLWSVLYFGPMSVPNEIYVQVGAKNEGNEAVRSRTDA